MLPFLFAALAAAAAAPAYTPAQLAEYKGQLKASCDISLKAPGVDVPRGFCGCFSNSVAVEAMSLTPQHRLVLLLLTEHAGDPIDAQKAAKSRHNIEVEAFAGAWDKLNPIGQKAGSACSKRK